MLRTIKDFVDQLRLYPIFAQLRIAIPDEETGSIIYYEIENITIDVDNKCVVINPHL